ncbi:hypothetical protein MKW94_012865 [Papaver nudicaule]|uniref:Uncharacterized protein n=1 Tax=Papaver nudicaule TaxID=74823 RepID=A0AA41W1M8_PAPNU|nr:hypothetical protein [Papaver nudicaule]
MVVSVSDAIKLKCFCSSMRRKNKINSYDSYFLLMYTFTLLKSVSFAGHVIANAVFNFLNIYNTILVVRLVLTWFPNSPPAITNPLSAATALPAELIPSTNKTTTSRQDLSSSSHSQFLNVTTAHRRNG